MNKLWIPLILILTVFMPSKAGADLYQSLQECQSIKSDNARLVCFDGILLAPATLQKQSSKQVPQVARIVTPATTPQVIQRAAVNDVDSFGQPDSHGLQKIESRMIGEFSRWSKGMRITLENGQIWKVTSNQSSYKKIKNPRITITKGVFGSFDAQVEGLNARAKVKRVK